MTQMDELLLLVHRMPYPPNKGDKIRSYHLLRQLTQHYRVHLGTFIDDADDWRHVPQVRALCASANFLPLSPLRGRLRSLRALLANRALSLDFYSDSRMRAWVAATMAERSIGRVVVFSAAMAQYVPQAPGLRSVVDFCDVDSDKWRQYAEKKRWPASQLYRYEASRLLRYERAVAARSDAALFVSREEAALFAQLAPESAGHIGHFNNGVDTVYFAPQLDSVNPYPPGQRAVVFTGAMDYWPNVDAVEWFAREILPLVRREQPAVRFHIVGARPTPAVLALARLDGVSVSGTVPDVRPYLQHAELAVAPLRVARGIQNKVLEAMAMARTVVVTPQALEGIAATPGSELLLASDAAAFASAVCQALAHPQAGLGRAARARVEADYGWGAKLAPLLALLAEAPAAPKAARDFLGAKPGSPATTFALSKEQR